MIRQKRRFLDEKHVVPQLQEEGASQTGFPNKKTNKGGEQVHANIEDDPNKGENIFVIIEGENIFVQARSKGVVNKNFLLLDNQSMVNQIANPSLLKNIWTLSKPITVHCNAGVTKTDLEGELGGMTVHHNPNSIAYVLSLKSVAEMHRVTYNSWDCRGVFMVHTPNRVVEFKPNDRGLHCVDVSADETVRHMLVTDGMTNHKDNKEEEEEVSKDFEQVENMTDHEDEEEEEEEVSEDFEQVGNQELEDTEGLNLKETEENKSNEYVSVNTVQGNFEGYTRHEIKKAQKARRLQGMIWNPTEQEFAGMVHEKLIINCPSLCKMSTMLTNFLVQTLLTSGAKQLGQNWRTLG